MFYGESSSRTEFMQWIFLQADPVGAGIGKIPVPVYQGSAQSVGNVGKGHAIDRAVILIKADLGLWPVKNFQVIVHLLFAAATIDGGIDHEQRNGISTYIIDAIRLVEQVSVDPSSIHHPGRIMHRRITSGIGK